MKVLSTKSRNKLLASVKSPVKHQFQESSNSRVFLLFLRPGKTLCERPCNTFVVPGKSRHHEHNECGPVVGWTQGAGVPGDCGLSSFSERQNREKQPCGAGRHEFWSFFMACLISLLRVPTNTVRLVSALLPVYRWVNCTSPYPPHS